MSNYHELFDPSKMSDNKLLEQLSTLRDRLMHAEQYGHFQMVNQLLTFINILETERETRRDLEFNESFRKKNKTDKDIILGRIEGVDPDE